MCLGKRQECEADTTAGGEQYRVCRVGLPTQHLLRILGCTLAAQPNPALTCGRSQVASCPTCSRSRAAR